MHSGCSGWTIVRNSATDYSVRMLGENPAQSLKLIRLTGPDAFMQAQDIYQMLTFLTGVLGVKRPGL